MLQSTKLFLSILNTDALIFISMRLSGTVLGIAAVFILCRAATAQSSFDTNGKGPLYDMLPLGPVSAIPWSYGQGQRYGKVRPQEQFMTDLLWILSWPSQWHGRSSR